MDKLKAWVYSRVAQPNETKLQKQEDSLIDFSLENGYYVVGITKESGSGLNFEREGLKQVLQNAEDKNFEYLIITDLSRIGRDIIKTEMLLSDLERKGIKVVTTLEQPHPNLMTFFPEIVRGATKVK